ncbi:MAG: DEAD/DEAH box helicase family protein [Deltaproteobacteria bacterium]|nr:DEAD/DEAH box helicase family protein [Deltaproteobacteria bacterium]
MSEFEVETPILNSPFDAPAEHWDIEHGRPAIRAQGRRPAVYYYRDPKAPAERYRDQEEGLAIELLLVNRIRRQLDVWRAADYDGVTRTTLELLRHWRREGRRQRLFFAQLEAAETVIFLVEAEARFRQGVEVPLDDPGEAKRAAGDKLLRRYACKMATGAGKTTVMAMLAAWSILNKLDSPDDARFSDAVLVVCPNVTIRQRLQELDPARMDASLYATRDLVPSALLPRLSSGRVVVTNWHVFEPRPLHVGDEAAKVVKAGVRRVSEERLTIGERKTTQGRGAKTITAREYEQQRAMGLLTVIEEKRDRDGELTSVRVESVRYEESDRAVLSRVLGSGMRGRKNVLVLNDEAHHAYRRRSAAPEAPEVDLDEEERDELEVEAREATVWVEGLDRLHRRSRGELLRRPLGDAVLPRERGSGCVPPVSVGGERLRAHRRDRVGAGEDPAARGARHDGRAGARVLQHLELGDPAGHHVGEGGQAEEPAARGNRSLRAPTAGHGGGDVARDLRGVEARRRRPALAGLHHRVQEHPPREAALRVDRRGFDGGGSPAVSGGGASQRAGGAAHASGRHEGRARDRHGRDQGRRAPVDALHARQRRAGRVARRMRRATRSTRAASRSSPKASGARSIRRVGGCGASSRWRC